MIQDESRSSSPSPTMNFDYLYEFSETRKVLEEFFKSGAENKDSQQLQFQVCKKLILNMKKCFLKLMQFISLTIFVIFSFKMCVFECAVKILKKDGQT